MSNKLLLQWAIIKIRAYKPKNLLLNVLVVKWLRIDIVSNQEDDAKRFLKMNPRIKVIKWNSKKKKKKDTKLHSSEEDGTVSVERWNFNWTKKDGANGVSRGWVSEDSYWFLTDGMHSTCLNFRSQANNLAALPTPTFQDPSLETEMILVWLSVESTDIYQEPTVFLALFCVLGVYQWGEKKKDKDPFPHP